MKRSVSLGQNSVTNKCIMKKITILAVLLLCTLWSKAQNIIAFQSFENTSSDTWDFTPNPMPYSNVSQSYNWSVIDDILNIDSGQDADNFWGIRDLNNNGPGNGIEEHILDFEDISLVNQSDVVFQFYYHTNGFSNTDYIKVELFFDGLSQGEEIIPRNSEKWELFSRVVPNDVNTFSFIIKAKQNGKEEYAGLDSFSLIANADTTPDIIVQSPSQDETIILTKLGYTIDYIIQNFKLSSKNPSNQNNRDGDGYLVYQFDDAESEAAFIDDQIRMPSLSQGNHTLTIQFVTNDGDPLNPGISQSIDFTIQSVIQQLPFTEQFMYAADEVLGDQSIWTNQGTNKEVKVIGGNLSYPDLSSDQGNSILIQGNSKDPFVQFSTVSSGKVYFSFLAKVTDLTSFTSSSYFITLKDNTRISSRLWIQRDFNGDQKFKIGISDGASTNNYTATSYTANETLFIVMSYDLDSNIYSVIINPDASKPEPTASLSGTDTSPVSQLNSFDFRLDRPSTLPKIQIDALRIGTSWSDVTTNTLNTSENNISDQDKISFSPNPIHINEELTINGLDNKQTELEVQLFSLLGKQIFKQKKRNSKISLQHLSPGLYLVTILENNKMTKVSRLMIR